MKVVAEVPVSKKENKLAPYVQELRKNEPDMVLLWVNPFSAFKILYLAKITRFAPVWLAPSPLSDYEYMYEKSRGVIEGLISVNYLTRDRSKIKKYKAFWKKHKKELGI